LVEKIIKRCVKPKQMRDADCRKDCMFVSVACTVLCKLVTNDDGHILTSKADLMIEVSKVQKAWPGEVDFLSSFQAHAHYCSPSLVSSGEEAGDIVPGNSR